MIVVDADLIIELCIRSDQEKISGGLPVNEVLPVLIDADKIVMSVISAYECDIALYEMKSHKGPEALRDLFNDLQISIEPATKEDRERAYEARTRFQNSGGFKLDLQEAFVYALAKRLNAPVSTASARLRKTDLKAP